MAQESWDRCCTDECRMAMLCMFGAVTSFRQCGMFRESMMVLLKTFDLALRFRAIVQLSDPSLIGHELCACADKLLKAGMLEKKDYHLTKRFIAIKNPKNNERHFHELLPLTQRLIDFLSSQSEAAKWGSVSREWSPSVIDATKKHNGPQIAFMRQQSTSAKKTVPQDRP